MNKLEDFENAGITTVDEMDRHCTKHSHIYLLSSIGPVQTVLQVKINGKVHRWKRDPERIAVPVKYGLYQCFTLSKEDMSRIMVRKDTSNV